MPAAAAGLPGPGRVKVARRFRLAKRAGLFHVAAMQSHELLREVFDRKNPKAISADLDLSTSMIYKWTQPPTPEGGIGNPLDRIEALIESTGDQRIVQWICQRAGGFFILNPHNVPHPHYLIPATNQIVQDFADLLAVVASAAADNQITAAESEQIRARWEELKTVTEGFVAACESGDFGALKEPELTQRRKEAKTQN
jgi:hypothetical protein